MKKILIKNIEQWIYRTFVAKFGYIAQNKHDSI